MALSARDLPSVADARRAGVRLKTGLFGRDLLDGGKERITAALVFRALLQVRSLAPMTLDMSWERASAMAKEPPPPAAGFDEGNAAYVAKLHGDGPSACTFDAPNRRGAMVCSVCSGSGYVEEVRRRGRHTEIVRVPCYGCRGATLVRCTNCDGTGLSVRAEVVKVLDRVVTIDEVILPRLGEEIEDGLRRALLARTEYPAELARDVLTWDPGSEVRLLGPELPELYRRAIAIGSSQGAANAVHRAFEAFVVPLLVLEHGAQRGVVVRAGEWTAGFAGAA
jgi:hypothetical protein